MDKVVISNSRWRYVFLLLVSLAFVVAGIVMIRDPSRGSLWVGVTGILFFGACAAVFVWQLLEQRPRLTINDDGINDRTLGVGVIPWHEITDAYVKTFKGNHFVCLIVRNPEMFLRNVSSVRRAMIKANQALGFSELNINLSGTAANPHEVHELVLKLSTLAQQRSI